MHRAKELRQIEMSEGSKFDLTSFRESNTETPWFYLFQSAGESFEAVGIFRTIPLLTTCSLFEQAPRQEPCFPLRWSCDLNVTLRSTYASIDRYAAIPRTYVLFETGLIIDDSELKIRRLILTRAPREYRDEEEGSEIFSNDKGLLRLR